MTIATSPLALGMAPRGRRPPAFRQSDLARALKAVVSAGLKVAEAMVTRDGHIRLVFADGAAVPVSGKANDWD